jgi:uncharacterized hydrophobic protein (TIGR00271 family)
MLLNAQGRLVRSQDYLSSLLGCETEARPQVVASMLRRNNDAVGYWLQLGVSIGIATLGLVLGSTAVVIGAMLIAPLMTPLVNLGMGLAVGSPFLVLRSSARVVASIVFAVGSSALITRLLPFNELNAEIAARTTPTALDLLVAAFCALAGVYAVLRQDSDVAATAAGTSIGISLVPPLCASGYGIGTATWTVASGAALLFVTNFVAIIVVSSTSFALTGFHQVDIRTLEAQELGDAGNAPVSRRLAKLFASRSGPWVRLLMPLVLLAAVYVPLRTALDEVVWQIRARKQVLSVIDELRDRVVQSRVHIERGRIELALVLLGSNSEAARARKRVEQAVEEHTGITPALEIIAIPDSKAFAGLQAALHRDGIAAPSPKAAATEAIAQVRGTVASSLEKRWPRTHAGAIAAASFRTSGPELVVEVVHLGTALDASTREVLERTLTEDLAEPVRLTDRALPREELVPEEIEAPEFIARLATLLEIARPVETISVCIVAPPEPTEKPTRRANPALEQTVPTVRDMLDRQPRAATVSGPAWRIGFVLGPCVWPTTTSSPAEAAPTAQ